MFRRKRRQKVLVYYDPKTGEEEFVELKGTVDPQYGVVFSPAEIERWISSHLEADRRRHPPQQLP